MYVCPDMEAGSVAPSNAADAAGDAVDRLPLDPAGLGGACKRFSCSTFAFSSANLALASFFSELREVDARLGFDSINAGPLALVDKAGNGSAMDGLLNGFGGGAG